MVNYTLVGAGGAAGDITHFRVSAAVLRCFGKAFPFGAVFINVILAANPTS